MRLLSLVALALAACAGAPAVRAVPVPMPTSAEGDGEVVFLPLGSVGNGAAFDAHRVVGPTVNMAATPEGVWGGDLRGRNVVLEVGEGRLAGAALELTVEREGDALRLAGLLGNRRVNFRVSPRQIQGTLDGGACSFDLSLESPGRYQGFLACPAPRGERLPAVSSASLRLVGDAARLDQPMLPQLALALLAVLPP
ncbi:MAG TPA: hypothetical protein VFI16_04340 [Anaeromyxobacteraceae bacterium]|nr:hypothetical protein [Anaeromyxobacteraceae bacterium]